MDVEFDVRLRTTLTRLLNAINLKLSANTFITDLKNENEKCISKKLQKLLAEFAKKDQIAAQIIQLQVQNDIDSNISAVECLKKFLKSYDEQRKARRAVGHPRIETINESVESSSIHQMSTQSVAATTKTTTTTSTGVDSLQRALQNVSTLMNNGGNDSISSTSSVTNGSYMAKSNGASSQMSHKSSTSTMNGSKSMNDSQLSSASSNEVTQDNLSEVMRKIVKAASDGVVKSSPQKNGASNTVASNKPTKNGSNERPHAKWYFNKEVSEAVAAHVVPANCTGLPIEKQEQLIIEDLIYLFIGNTGDFITPKFTEESENGFAPVEFEISDQIDISLRNMTRELLPMAASFSIVQKFVQWAPRTDNQMLQAISEVLQDFLNDYRVSICQLDRQYRAGVLTLHKLIYLTRIMHLETLKILATIVQKITIGDRTGGEILSLLFDEITLQTGNQKAQKMLIELTELASVPYIEMLERWILKGVIVDGCDQFFIVDHAKEMGNVSFKNMGDYDTARYWDCRYTIQPERIPSFLENDADIILRTGKYLNVIRQCGKQIVQPAGVKKLQFNATNQGHSATIKQAYHNASKTLLDLLMKEKNLVGHISSVKRYFLLQQGDLITQFMDASEDELTKNVDKVMPMKLINLLQAIVRSSSAKDDPCLEHLSCDLFPMDLVEQMSKIYVAGHQGASLNVSIQENVNLSGIECFTFNYNVQWPVSLVLNQWALTQYQMLFRFLFYCKHVERQLGKVWIENSGSFKSDKKNAKSKADWNQWRLAFALRQRMLDAIQHLENYMMIEIIEPNWHVFNEKMKHVQNIDEVMAIHQDFLHTCVHNCMLNYPDILGAVMNTCGSCLKFCKFIESADGQKVTLKWQKYVESSAAEFDGLLIHLLSAINSMTSETRAGSKLLNLVGRINFNGVYTEKLEQYAAKNNNNEQEI